MWIDDKGAAVKGRDKGRDKGREGSGRMKETDGKREEIKNFAWVLYDREKNTGSGPPPISAIQIPALSHFTFLFFLTTILSFNPLLPSEDPSKTSSACLPAMSVVHCRHEQKALPCLGPRRASQ